MKGNQKYILKIYNFQYYQLIGMIWAFIRLYALILINKKSPEKKEKDKKRKKKIT